MISSPSVSSVTSDGIDQVADVHGRVEVGQRLDRVLDGLRQVIGQGAHPDRLDRVEERAALERDGRRLAGGHERDVHGQLLGHPDQEQVDVEGPAVDRMDLDRRDEDRARLVAIDREVDQGVRAGVAAELLELVRVDRDARGVDAVAVDDGRQAAGGAEAGDLLAGDVAMFGGQRRAGGGHVGEPQIGLALVGAAARRRGRCGEAPG